MKTGDNWANRPGPTPGNPDAVRMHKSIAMGMTAPKSERKTMVDLAGSKTGRVKVPGL
jgi:hypothetical protein